LSDYPVPKVTVRSAGPGARTIKQVNAPLNKNLQFIYLLRVMFDPRITLQ